MKVVHPDMGNGGPSGMVAIATREEVRTAPPGEDWYRLLLWCVDGIGPVRYTRLLEHFGQAARAIRAGPMECARALDRPGLQDRFCRTWPDASREAQLSKMLQGQDLTALQLHDPGYPGLLRSLGEPPWLFVRGDPGALGRPLAAIVGTRAAGFEGIRCARRVVDWCVQGGWCTVSGGALGVDAEVHRASIEVGAITVAVMPAGLLHLAPHSERSLFEEVVEKGGCLVSEHPPWRTPRSELFVRRNRLISGMAAFTVVVRAPRHSGALITAQWARRQQRPVYVVPGSPEDPTASGCLEAIRSGARLLSSAEDLPRCREGVQAKEPKPGPVDHTASGPDEARLSGEQRWVLQALRAGPRTLDDLVLESGALPGCIAAAVTELMLMGHILRSGPALYTAVSCGQRGGP